MGVVPRVVHSGNPVQLIEGNVQLLCQFSLFHIEQSAPHVLPVVAKHICICAAQREHHAVNVALLHSDGVLFGFQIGDSGRTEQAVLPFCIPDNAGALRNVVEHDAERFRIGSAL